MLLSAFHGQLGKRGDGHEDGDLRQERAAQMSAALRLSNREGDRDDVTLPEREHVLASQRRLQRHRKNRQNLFSAVETGQVSDQVKCGPVRVAKLPSHGAL